MAYFRQGLQDAERCLWLAHDEEASEKARHVIAALADSQYSPDQLEAMHADEWTSDVDAWTREEERALVQEALELDRATAVLRIEALCIYNVERTQRAAVPDIIRAHHAALIN